MKAASFDVCRRSRPTTGGFNPMRNSGSSRPQGDTAMNLHLSLAPLLALIAGILILVMPRLLNFIVAIYLIIIGLIGLLGTGSLFK
jgi:hypothetical protein